MLQRYKVRLGDGTVLSVEEDGLKTWLEDRRAMVQAVGTQPWRPLHELVAELESAARLARALVPPKPRGQAAPPPAPVSPPPFELPGFDEPPVAVASRPSLQVLADEPVSAPADSGGTSTSDDDMPIIRMKPLDDEPEFRSAWADEPEQDDEEFLEDQPRHDRLEGPLLRVLETFGGFLSRCLDPLTPFVDRLLSSRPKAPTPRRSDAEAGRPTLAARLSTSVARLSMWAGGLAARLRRREAAEPPEPIRPPAAKREPARPLPRPVPARQPVAAPTPVSELPVLRFAETREAREEADVYEGEEPSFSLQPAWLWTKRLVVIGALAAGVTYAVLERDSWFPRAADVGQTVFTEIDRQARSRERSQQQQQALAAASARLPQLAPETIQLVFAASPSGVLEPPEVFQLATEAAERGQAALSAAEAEELRALQRELLATLGPAERELVREYERTRQRRLIFPFENPQVMELVARGAKALPDESRERLQTLQAKAVAAGLTPGGGPVAGPGAAR